MSQKRLLVALSFWEGDRAQANRLARLLADVEPVKTAVFDLLLLARFDTTVDEATAEYCRHKFDVYTSLGTIQKVGYPAGAWATWRGCYDWAVAQQRYDAVMTIESDSVPLTEDWAARVSEAWALQPGVGVMGDVQPPQTAAHFGEHVNGNAVFSTRPDVAAAIQAWAPEQDGHPWDLYGHPVWAAFGVNDTRTIQSDFRSARLTPGYLDRLISKGVVWLHGCKDNSAYDWAKARFTVSRPSAYIRPPTAVQTRTLPFFTFADTVPSVLEQGLGGHIVNPESFFDPAAYNFNPSICKVGGMTGMFYRSRPRAGASTVRFGTLSPDRGSLVRDTLVEGLPTWPDGAHSHYEDPRFVELDGSPYLAFIHGKYWFDLPEKPPAWMQCLVPITVNASGVVRAGPLVDTRFKSNTGNYGSFEKNWAFFGEGSRRFFVYKADPHEIVEMPSGQSERSFINCLASWKLNWGTPRGGSSPVLVGDRWFSFFHSSIQHPTRRRRYMAGVYSFAAGGQHSPDKVSTGPILTGSERDGFQWSRGVEEWEPIVVFPAGAIYEAGTWTFSAGINDCRCGLFSISHDDLLKRMG